MASHIPFIEIPRNAAGQRRFVCLFYNLLTVKEIGFCRYGINQEADGFALAVKRARSLGGKKFNSKRYTGFIAFVAPDFDVLEQAIADMLKELEK